MHVRELSLACFEITITTHNFRSHVSYFTKNTKVLLVCGYIVVVANQQISRLRIEKETTIVQILVGESLFVQFLKCNAQLNTPPD